MRDLRYAFRSLARTPLFAVTAVADPVAVGRRNDGGVHPAARAGAAAAADRRIPHELVRRPDRRPARPRSRPHRGGCTASSPRTSRSFSRPHPIDRSIRDAPSKAIAALVRGAVAGVAGQLLPASSACTPALGRLIQPADVRPDGCPPARRSPCSGWNFWQRHFGGDPDVVGRTIKADGVPLTIIGVAPKDFLGFSISIEHDVTVPIAPDAVAHGIGSHA